MEKFDIFKDIAQRTGGDIYIGAVGPMRVGKSTFIRRFMELFVLPNITDPYDKQRAVDAMPQAGAGKTIMTVEPKFIPDEAVQVDIRDDLSLNVRLVDCTGYPVEGAQGYTEGDEPRRVMTPWFDEPVAFVAAAEIGTEKVVEDHSTIGIVVTTDGSIVDIPRSAYVEPEREIVEKLARLGKPFVIILNSVDPYSKEVADLAINMEGEYGVPVIPANCLELNHDDIVLIMEQVLYEFPVKDMTVRLPKWVQMLSHSHWLRNDLESSIRDSVASVKRVRDIDGCVIRLSGADHVTGVKVTKVNMATGEAALELDVAEESFFEIIGEKTGLVLADKADVLNMLEDLVSAKRTLGRFELAMRELDETGYGIVEPTVDDMIFEEPEMIRQGRNYGVRLRARGPAIHMIQTEIETQVNPVIGSEEQGEELVAYLMEKFEDDPRKIWATDLFGKSLRDIVLEGVTGKIAKMPENARAKMQETLGRVVNEGSGSLICIIL